MKRFWLILLLTVPLAAQEQKKPESPQPVEVRQDPQQTKLFILRYADPFKLVNLLKLLGAESQPSSDLHALAVWVRVPGTMPAIEEAIKRLDVPAAAVPNIEVTAYYILAGENAQSGSAIPKELESTVAQLKNAFPFRNYRLLDSLFVRTRSGDTAEASSTPGGPDPALPTIVNQLKLNATLNPDTGMVRINGLKAGMRTPVESPGGTADRKNFSYSDLGLNADVDIKEGQKVVVGRQSLNHDLALFLVLTAHVVN